MPSRRPFVFHVFMFHPVPPPFDTGCPSCNHPPPRRRSGRIMLLTKHDAVTFTNQTVYISGQAFIRCNFVGCTLVLKGDTVYHLEECSFDRCNWHVDCVMLWGSAE